MKTLAKTRFRYAVALILAAFASGLMLRAAVPQVPTGTWMIAGSLGEIPQGAAAVALDDGRLMVAGGTNASGAFTATIAIYDPAAAWWAPAGELTVARAGHTATLLQDGRVLFAGGATDGGPTFDIEVFDPTTGVSTHLGDMTLARVDHAAATLKDGRVLIVGGWDGTVAFTLAEIFDPSSGQSIPLSTSLAVPRVDATATTLLDGHVLIAGGHDGTTDLASAQIFDATYGDFEATGPMQTARSGHTAVLLPANNQVLIAGGKSGGTAVATAELFADWNFGFSPAPSAMSTPRAGGVAGGLKPYDLALVAGGGSTSGEYYGYATIKTDKDDYAPGEIVTIYGSGWQPGETVTLKVTEDADTHYDWNLTAVADQNGNIINQDFYPREDEQFQHLGMRFYVMASGAASQALTTFTDGNVKVASNGGLHFNYQVTHFGSSNCTTGAGSPTTKTANAAGSTTGVGNNESLLIVANENANAPNAGATFSHWTAPPNNQSETIQLAAGYSLTDRTICVVGFQNGSRDLIGHYNASGAVSVTVSPLSVAEDGAPNLVYTFTRGRVTNQALTVNFSVGGTATFGTDYTQAGAATFSSSTGTVVIPANSATAIVTVNPTTDNIDEPDETVILTVTSGTGYSIGTPSAATGTITDDDATPTFSINDVSLPEGNTGTTTFTFNVTLSNPSASTITVDYATADGTAIAPGDYAAHTTTTLTFAPGETSKSVMVLVNGDAVYENNETFTVALSNATNATIGDGSGLGTIQNDDAPPVFSINDVSQAEGNAGTSAFTFTVTKTGATEIQATVDFATADGSATQPTDYASTSGTLTFAAGDSSKPVTVTVNGDLVFEGDQTFTVTLSNPTNATIGDGSGLGTIQNDDAPPVITINDVTQAEGNAGTSAFTFIVTKTGATEVQATVDFATANGTAVQPGDYASNSGTLTFATNETTKQVTVLVNGDVTYETHETFTVNLSNAANATIGDPSGLGTITNDDAPPTFAINDVSAAEGDAGTTSFVFTVSKTGATEVTATVNYAIADGTAAQPGDYSGTSGTLTFLPNDNSETITVLVNGDNLVENDETFFVNLSGASEATITDAQGVGTIQNEDFAPVAMNDHFVTGHNTPATGNVLTNDTDADDSTLTAQKMSDPTNGTVVLNADGSFVYTPSANFQGVDSFTYRASDGTNVSNTAIVTIRVAPGGQLRTYTQGGWGSTPHGNNPGALLCGSTTGPPCPNFAEVYPAGITVGNNGAPFILRFTSAPSVENFLPAGGKASALKASDQVPTPNDRTSSSAGVFAGQVLALQISVDFSDAGMTPVGLGARCVKSGPLAGKTVQEVLDLANRVLGGETTALPTGMSVAQLNDVVTRINENYDGGKVDRGYLGSCAP